MKTMADKLDRDLASAIDDGLLDPARHAALMAGARLCAQTIDSTPSPTAAMFSALLNYIRALGLAPTNSEIDRRRKPKPSGPSKLDEARARLWKDNDRLIRATAERADVE